MRRSKGLSVKICLLLDMEIRKTNSQSKPTLWIPLKHSGSVSKSLWIFLSMSMAFLLFLYGFVDVKGSRPDFATENGGFSIIIDGGSTGTRIHVYKFFHSGGLPAFDLDKGGGLSMKVNPGLSSYADDPALAGSSLVELLKFAKSHIPEDYWMETEIRLMATAGLRRLDLKVQEQLLKSCRQVLRNSGFRFHDDWASVITGSDEGIFAWVSANYAIGTLGGTPSKTSGIIELGGASAQITFVSSGPLPSELSHTLKIGAFKYNLYSNSLLNFGQNVAYESLHEFLMSSDLTTSGEFTKEGLIIDPCRPQGSSSESRVPRLDKGDVHAKKGSPLTFNAKGNFTQCRSAALMLLQNGNDMCDYERCNVGSNFVPELQGKLLATENFFYTSKFFGLSSKSSLYDLMLSGQQFCGEDLSILRKKYPSTNEEDLLQYCFSSAYIVTLLNDSLGIPLDDKRISFANQISGIPLDWALGAFILQNMAHIDTNISDWMPSIFPDTSYLIHLLLACLLIFMIWAILRWKIFNLKTIYDVERGSHKLTRGKQ